MGLSVSRSDLLNIVAKAAKGRPEGVQARLMRAMTTTDAVAFGWFHHDGVACPARQASYRGQEFQEAYDRAMFAHFGIEFDVCKSFVATVVD